LIHPKIFKNLTGETVIKFLAKSGAPLQALVEPSPLQRGPDDASQDSLETGENCPRKAAAAGRECCGPARASRWLQRAAFCPEFRATGATRGSQR